MATWETPKTDWNSSQQGVGNGDFNRIEENIEFLGDRAPIQDYEGNSYRTVYINGQQWTIDNWRASTYADGTPIPEVTDQTAWDALTSAAYCKYDNTTTLYGYLYNGDAVDSQFLPPAGWHVATDADFNNLFTYLNENGYNYDLSIGTGADGSKAGAALASSLGWSGVGAVTGDPGATPWLNNSTGIGLVPGGFRTTLFDKIGDDGRYWAIPSVPPLKHALIQHDNAGVSLITSAGVQGYSVRMVRDV
jgi:uncharacterized protein (TIGR02145 family)